MTVIFLDAVCKEIWEIGWIAIFMYIKEIMKITWKKKQHGLKVKLASIDKAKNTYRKELEWMRKQPKARTTKSKSRQDNFYEVEKKAKQKN